MKKRLLHRFYPCATAPSFTSAACPVHHIALLELCKDFFSRHTAGKQLLQHIFCFALLCFFCCFCFGGSFFVFGFGKVPWWAAFNSAFLAFSCVFRSSRFAVNVATSDSIFSFFAAFFCNDCYIINAGLYSTSLILASLGSCHNNSSHKVK